MLPRATRAIETTPTSLTPYLSAINPAGSAKKMPGITTIVINNPASAALAMENCIIKASINGGTSWKTKA
jgi:hypothetical protein